MSTLESAVLYFLLTCLAVLRETTKYLGHAQLILRMADFSRTFLMQSVGRK